LIGARDVCAVHGDLATRWHTFTIAAQLGNIGSEVGRALKWRKKGNTALADKALARCLELFDLTIEDPRWAGHRRREISRAREVVCDFFIGDNQYGSTPQTLDKYFLAFAVVANRERSDAATA
jgi:hypothetical protein